MTLKIGTAIKELRIKNKVTQDQLACGLGVTPQAISRWEAENGYPDIELLPSIADFFSVTVDDILGINRPEKEKRLAEIHHEISVRNELGNDQEDALDWARQRLAEFPTDEKIREHLASVLAGRNMWNENPDVGEMKEAEKIYLSLIDTTEDELFRCALLDQLCALYHYGFKDEFKVEMTLARLPSMKYCRESVAAYTVDGEKGKEYTQDYIDRLTGSLADMLSKYIVSDIRNDPDMWDKKIEMLEWTLGLYEYIYGDNLLYHHDRAAWVCYLISTYKLAQGKADETFDYLGKMYGHLVPAVKAKPGDRFTSIFTDRLVFPEIGDEFDWYTVHNSAWHYIETLSKPRFDSIRDDARFVELLGKIKKIAE